MKGSKLLSIQKVAKTLGVTKKEVVGLIDGGYIAAVKVDDTYLVSESAINDFTNRSTQKDTTVSGQQDSGYPPTHAVECHQQELYSIEEEIGDGSMFTGSVTCTGGRYISQITLEKLANGKRKRESKSFKTREEAESHLGVRLAELNGVITMPNIQTSVKEEKVYTTMSVKQFVNHYFTLGIGAGGSRTQKGYRDDIKTIVNDMGNRLINEVSKKDIKVLFQRYELQFTKVVLDKKWRTCKKIFTYAYKAGYIQDDLFDGLDKPKSRKVTRQEKYKIFTEEELELIMRVSKSHKKLYAIFAVLESTGMRPGELRALEWIDFNQERATLDIRQAATKTYEDLDDITDSEIDKEIISVTKSAYSVRQVYFNKRAVDALVEWRIFLNKQKEPMRSSNYIFPGKDGDFMKESAMRSLITRFAGKEEVKGIGIHLYKFRHTMCTRLVLEGVAIPVIQVIMGDNTPDVITQIYTHVQKKDGIVAAQRLFAKQDSNYLVEQEIA